MSYTNSFYILYTIIILFIVKINCEIKYWNSVAGVGTSDYDTSTNWLPAGVPTQNDDVYFLAETNTQFNDAIIQGHKYMNSFVVEVDADFRVSAIGNLNINQALLNYLGTVEFYSNISAVGIRNDYVMLSGIYSFVKAIMYNNNLMISFRSLQFDEDYFGRPGSYFYNYNSDTLQVFNQYTELMGDIEFTSCLASFNLLNITSGGYLTITNTTTFFQSDLNIEYGTLYATDSFLIPLSNSIITDHSNFTLRNSSVLVSNDNYLTQNKTFLVYNLNSNYNCIFRFYSSKFHLFHSTLLLSTNSYIFMHEGSTLGIDNGYLIMIDNSLIQLNHSNAAILEGAHYLQDSSWFACLNRSLVSINGSFTMRDDSKLTLYQDSILLTYGAIILFEDSLINVADNSSISTIDSMKLFARSTLVVESSLCAINGSMGLYDNSSFISIDSDTGLTGEFIANGTVQLIFENSQFIVLSNFTSMLGAITIFNSTLVEIIGSLQNIDAQLQIYDSEVNVHSHLYSKGLVYSNSSSFTILGGNFDMEGSFTGHALNISILQGNLTMMTLDSNFICNECNITLLAGYVSILNSTIESKEYFDLRHGRIEGNGTFNGNVQTTGQIGSDNKITNNITINGSFHIDSGKVIMVVDSLSDFSTLSILNKINVSSTNIEIRVNEDLLGSLDNNQILDLITYKSIINNNNSSSSSGDNSNSDNSNSDNSNSNNSNSNNSSDNNKPSIFNNIVFKTYNKDSEPKESNSCQLSVTESNSKFQLLISSSSCSNEKLSTSKAWIAGVIVPIVVVVGISMVVYHYRGRLSIFYKLKKQSFDTKLQSIRSKK